MLVVSCTKKVLSKYEDGSLRTIEISYPFSDRELVRVFMRNGLPLEEYEQRNGLKDGSYTAYHPNGRLRIVQSYHNDTLQGYEMVYSHSGSLISQGFFEKGLINGPVTHWDSLGTMILKSNFVDGEMQDTLHTYFPNGQLRSVGRYHDDKPVGTHLFFEQNGDTLDSLNYNIVHSIGR